MSQTSRRPPGRDPAQAASRPLQILEAVALSKSPASAQQLVAATGIPAPSLYRLVSRLVEDQYLVRAPDGSGFQLGVKVAPMAQHFAEQQAWPTVLQAMRRAEQRLAREVVAAVHANGGFHLPEDQLALLGEPELWHATALGKLLVAYRRDLLARLTFTRFTTSTHPGPVALVRELDEVVDKGVSLERQEVLPDRHAVAVAVIDSGGNLAGALCVVGVAEAELDTVADCLSGVARPSKR